MGPKTVKNLKTLFHALTVASLALTQVGGLIPAKYMVLAAFATSVISAILNVLTRMYPWLATETESDDPAV